MGYNRTMSPNCVVDRRLATWLFVASASLMLVLHNGGLSGLDGETYYQAAKSFVDHGRLDVGGGFNSTTGVGGREYAKSNLGLPLLAGVIFFSWGPPRCSAIRMRGSRCRFSMGRGYCSWILPRA